MNLRQCFPAVQESKALARPRIVGKVCRTVVVGGIQPKGDDFWPLEALYGAFAVRVVSIHDQGFCGLRGELAEREDNIFQIAEIIQMILVDIQDDRHGWCKL